LTGEFQMNKIISDVVSFWKNAELIRRVFFVVAMLIITLVVVKLTAAFFWYLVWIGAILAAGIYIERNWL
jgi:uncharacterized membrane protein